MATDADYYKYSVIKPPTIDGDNEKITRLIVDSRVRNVELYPNPNDYELLLDDDINDVVSAELIYSQFYMNGYLIDSYFNTLHVEYDGTVYPVTLSLGNYNVTELKDELESKFDSVLGAGVMQVTYSTKLDKYIFTKTGGGGAQFKFKFKGYANNLALLLGFCDKKDYESVDSVITAPFRVNFDYNNYLIMDIEQFDLLKSSDSELNRTFAVISKTMMTMNVADQFHYIKRFTPPIARLPKLRIRIYDKFGNKYDFQNKDHFFELVIKSCKHKRKYLT
jgi:hypothetical protein